MDSHVLPLTKHDTRTGHHLHSIYVGEAQSETDYDSAGSTGVARWGWRSPKKCATSSIRKNALTFDTVMEAAAGPGIAEYKDGDTQSTVVFLSLRASSWLFLVRSDVLIVSKMLLVDSFENVQLQICRNCNDWFEDAFAQARIEQCTALMHCAKQLLSQCAVGCDSEMVQVSHSPRQTHLPCSFCLASALRILTCRSMQMAACSAYMDQHRAAA